MSFLTCLAFVKAREGGWSDHPTDAGGSTLAGITQATYDSWRRSKQLPAQPVSSSTDDERSDIYRTFYWEASRADKLPWPLCLVHFDAAVNHGNGTAGRMLQTALGITLIDGIIGTTTIAAAEKCDPLIAASRYCNLRINRYNVLVLTDPSQHVFLRGWLARIGHLLLSL